MDDYARAELIAVIRQVRKRWRTKLAIRGAVGFLVAGVLCLIAGASFLLVGRLVLRSQPPAPAPASATV